MEIFYILPAIAILALLGTLIANIIFAFQFKQVLIENSIFQYQNRDLNTKLIYNITQKDKCEEREETLVLGTWFGSINKCKCPQRIFNSDCKAENKDCTTISGEPKNYTKFYEKSFCAIRKGKTYKELIQENQIKNKNDSCPENYISCGIIDTLDRKLCVKNGEECPITIKDIAPTTDSFINEESENNNNSLISLIEVGENYPCMNYSEKVWTTYDANDRNDVTSCSNIGGKEYDDRFILIKGFKINKTDFYKNNDIDDYYITDELKNLPVYLYGRVLFGLDYNREDINYERMIEIQENVNIYGKAIKTIIVVMFIVFAAPIALAFVCLGLAGSGLASGGGSCDCGDICKGVLKFLGADFGIVVVLGNLANFIVNCLMLRNLNELKGIIKVFENSDPYTNILVESILDLLNMDFNYSLSIVILMSSSLFFIIVCGIYYKFWRTLFYKKQISEHQKKLKLEVNYENNENDENNENNENTN